MLELCLLYSTSISSIKSFILHSIISSNQYFFALSFSSNGITYSLSILLSSHDLRLEICCSGYIFQSSESLSSILDIRSNDCRVRVELKHFSLTFFILSFRVSISKMVILCRSGKIKIFSILASLSC